MLVARASRYFSQALTAGQLYPSLAKYHLDAANAIMANLRKDPQWFSNFGLHAAAGAGLMNSSRLG